MPAKLGMRWVVAAAGLFTAYFVHAVVAQADPNALWNIVHGQCVPNEQQHGDAKPCAEVNLKSGLTGGFAVLKDIRGATQFLLIPTQQISGIESRALLAPSATNYFADAWCARRLVEKALGHAMPRDTLSLAINSELARTQNQLHIHIDCVRADVRDELRRERSEIGWRWRPLPGLLAGHRYRAVRVSGSTLAGHNPFKLLAWGVPGARADMGHHTLVVVGMQYAHRGAGFVILDDHVDPAHGDNAGGEELQDHACALGHAKS
ncbi:MAG: CDP-diacylglycerol diphosphatase [Xanthobacteraceae bacterium]